MRGLLLILVLTAGAPGAAAEVAVTLTFQGRSLSISIRNGGSEPIFLPGCNHYLLERKEASAFKVERQKLCVWEGYALPVEPGQTSTFEEAADALPAGTYRVRVEYAVGCERGKPLSQAGCKEMRQALSAEVTLPRG